MKTLHEKKSFHGHLSSHNVILQESHCLVSDLGLFNIKKYASVKDGYGNKGFWTSPEQWLENDRAVVNPAASDDVYSFGILLWEVLTGDMPFESLRGSEMRTEIGVNKKTPRVPGYFPKQIRKLLEICWSPVETRGTMDAVQQKLLSLRFEVIAE
jgi:serine/threonine protein kinase